MGKLKRILIEVLEDYVEKLKADNSNLTEEQALQLVSELANITIDKYEASERLGISERTFDRKIAAGEIPAGIKQYKETKIKWKLSDILKLKEYGYNKQKQ